MSDFKNQGLTLTSQNPLFSYISFFVATLPRKRIIGGTMSLAPKLRYFESAFVDVKVDIPLLEIRSDQMPYSCTEIHFFNTLPYLQPQAFTLPVGVNIKQLQRVTSRHGIRLYRHATDFYTVNRYRIGFAHRVLQSSVDFIG